VARHPALTPAPRRLAVDRPRGFPYSPALVWPYRCIMRIRNSLKSAKTRDKNNRLVRRRGRLYVINKKNPRMKARQG